jgi:chemotaxis protein histidine kinase CheA
MEELKAKEQEEKRERMLQQQKLLEEKQREEELQKAKEQERLDQLKREEEEKLRLKEVENQRKLNEAEELLKQRLQAEREQLAKELEKKEQEQQQRIEELNRAHRESLEKLQEQKLREQEELQSKLLEQQQQAEKEREAARAKEQEVQEKEKQLQADKHLFAQRVKEEEEKIESDKQQQKNQSIIDDLKKKELATSVYNTPSGKSSESISKHSTVKNKPDTIHFDTLSFGQDKTLPFNHKKTKYGRETGLNLKEEARPTAIALHYGSSELISAVYTSPLHVCTFRSGSPLPFRKIQVDSADDSVTGLLCPASSTTLYMSTRSSLHMLFDSAAQKKIESSSHTPFLGDQHSHHGSALLFSPLASTVFWLNTYEYIVAINTKTDEVQRKIRIKFKGLAKTTPWPADIFTTFDQQDGHLYVLICCSKSNFKQLVKKNLVVESQSESCVVFGGTAS